MVAKAKFRLEGEDATAAAFRSALGHAQETSEKMRRLFEKAFIGISILGVVELGKRTIEMGDNLNKAAIKAGVTGKAISELSYAAKMSDVDLGSLSTALKKMQVNLSEAGTGAKEPKDALAALGLQIKDLHDMKADQQFEVLADRISKLKDPADRTRAAVQLFGKAGADLLPMFEQGAEGIRKAREEAQKMGASFSDEQLQKLAAADDAMKRLHGSWDAFWVDMVSKYAPAISVTLDLFHGQTPAITADDRIASLKRQIAGIEAEATATTSGLKKLAELRLQLRVMQGDSFDDFASRRSKALAGSAVAPPGYTPPVKAVDDLAAVRVTAQKVQKSAMQDYYDELDKRTQTSIEKQWAGLEETKSMLVELRNAGRISADELDKRYSEAFDNVLSEVKTTAKKIGDLPKIIEALPDRARDFAQSAAADFDEFLFDPVHKGIKGLAQDLLSSLRHAIADGLTDKIFGSKVSGGFGFGDAIAAGAKKLFGFADGGSFQVGGSGGTDSQLVAFKASPNERVSITKPGQGGGMIIAPVYNIDNRGATVDAIQALPAVLARNNKALEAHIVAGLRNGRYDT